MQGLGIFIHPTIVQRILSFLGPWDRTQNAPLVCKRWARIVRDPRTHERWPVPARGEREMARIIQVHLLEQNGPFGNLIRSCLPAPCMMRTLNRCASDIFNYLINGRLGLFTFHHELFSRMIPSIWKDSESFRKYAMAKFGMWYHASGIRNLRHTLIVVVAMILASFELVDPVFWAEFCPLQHEEGRYNRIDLLMEKRPLYACYTRFIHVLEERFGITCNLGRDVQKEIDIGPDRQAKRRRFKESAKIIEISRGALPHT